MKPIIQGNTFWKGINESGIHRLLWWQGCIFCDYRISSIAHLGAGILVNVLLRLVASLFCFLNLNFFPYCVFFNAS